jgi:hypothetical protein
LAGLILLPLLLANLKLLQQQIDTETTVSFGENIQFRASIFPGDRISSASVSIRNPATRETRLIPAQIISGNTAIASATLELSEFKLAPFSIIEYWWHFAYQDGSSSESRPLLLEYQDDRFSWNILSRVSLTVYWVAGVADIAELGFDNILRANEIAQSQFSLDKPSAVRLIIYPTQESLQAGIGDELLLGHAEPALGLIYAAGDQENLAQIIRHELMHNAIFLRAGNGYAQIPAWLNEGLSTLAEDAGNYELTETFPLSNLCSPLPFRGPSASLAYTQSASVVAFIRANFGDASITALLDAYSEAETCDQGVQQVLRLSLDELETIWRQASYPDEARPPSFLPWLLLALPVLVALLASLGLRRTNR